MSNLLAPPRPVAKALAGAGWAARAYLLLLLPDGGQQVARRNAWAALVDQSARERMWREVDGAVAASAAKAADARRRA